MPIHPRRLDQAHDRRRPFAAAQRPGKQPVRASKGPWSNLVLDLIVVDGHRAIFDIASQSQPAFEAVIQGFRRG